jgi:hypothetical protein
MKEDNAPRLETVIRLVDGEPDVLVETQSRRVFRLCRSKGYEPIGQRIEGGDTARFCIPRFAIAIRKCQKREPHE